MRVDCLLSIVFRYSVPSTIFGSGGSKMNIEQWRCVHTLRGHSGGEIDLLQDGTLLKSI